MRIVPVSPAATRRRRLSALSGAAPVDGVGVCGASGSAAAGAGADGDPPIHMIILLLFFVVVYS